MTSGVLEVLVIEELGVDASHPPLPKGANKVRAPTASGGLQLPPQ